VILYAIVATSMAVVCARDEVVCLHCVPPCPVPPRIDNDRHVVLKATVSSSVELPCQTSGVPAPRVIWQKGTRVIADLPGNVELLASRTD